jgi:DNA ligase 1
MSRKKKDVNSDDLKVQVCLFVFDMIYLNGESLMGKSFRDRRAIMQDHVPIVEGQLDYAKGMDSDDTDEIQKFLEQSVECKHFSKF